LKVCGQEQCDRSGRQLIIGAAFGKIVESVVGDLIMPFVGAVVGKIGFSRLVEHPAGYRQQ
jgi:large-conductance mechanosensitive channel